MYLLELVLARGGGGLRARLLLVEVEVDSELRDAKGAPGGEGERLLLVEEEREDGLYVSSTP